MIIERNGNDGSVPVYGFDGAGRSRLGICRGKGPCVKESCNIYPTKTARYLLFNLHAFQKTCKPLVFIATLPGRHESRQDSPTLNELTERHTPFPPGQRSQSSRTAGATPQHLE